MKAKRLGWLGFVVLAVPGMVSAEVLYSNLGSGSSFDLANLWGISSGSSFAWQFTATSTGYATSLDAPVQSDNGAGPVTVTFTIYSDSSNALGSSLESVGVLSTGSLGSQTLASAALSGTTMLTAGQKYWLYGVGNAYWYWNLNNQAISGLGYYNGSYWNGAGLSTLPAFRVNGAVPSVPEPGSFALLALGLAGLGLTRRREET